ncbi:hypothetical protein ACJMK2_018256 [Sinanodonta woodiana]|uniref:Uncharacterized protein n=1 Tax=Sinanodonta woodiana TaxID=1069815 RepID=A0ABD3UCY4_SINWO
MLAEAKRSKKTCTWFHSQLYVLFQKLFESTMRTILLLQPLLLLVLAHRIEIQETITEATTTEDGLFWTQYLPEYWLTTTESNPPLPYKQSAEKEKDRYTAGNTLCRADQKCDFHQGVTYKYCYVDYSNNWDYCCTGDCDYHGYTYMWCDSGDQWQYCGDPGETNIDGRPCHYAYPCGMHQEKSRASSYWCYVDHKLNWNRCCSPSSKCDYHGYSYKWCYTGYKKETNWQYCK